MFSVFPRRDKTQQNTEALNCLQSGPRKFAKSDFSALAPIQRVLKNRNLQGKAENCRNAHELVRKRLSGRNQMRAHAPQDPDFPPKIPEKMPLA